MNLLYLIKLLTHSCFQLRNYYFEMMESNESSLSREQFDFVKRYDDVMKVYREESNRGDIKRTKMQAKVVEHSKDSEDERWSIFSVSSA